MNYRKLSKMIEKEMEEKGISWSKMAKKTNRNRVAVYKSIRYAENPRWETIVDILKVLGKKVVVE